MREAGLTEIDILAGDVRLHLVRAAPVMVQAAPTTPPAAVVHTTAVAPSAPADEPAAPANAVLSPMVGIAYLAPEPGATPFIAVGQAVTAGQTVLLIEAMKTFNEIVAPRAGTISAVFVEDGQPVEYGEPLIVIE